MRLSIFFRPTLWVVCSVACVSCAAPQRPQPDPAIERLRADQLRLEARVAALEEGARRDEPPPPPREPEVAQPDRVEAPVWVGEHHYRVPRRYFDEMVQNPDETLRSARIVPVQTGGRVTGLRLFGIRPGTRLDALGFENGDSLEAINELPLTTPEQALEAHRAVRNAESIRVRVKRGDREVELRYDLVE